MDINFHVLAISVSYHCKSNFLQTVFQQTNLIELLNHHRFYYFRRAKCIAVGFLDGSYKTNYHSIRVAYQRPLGFDAFKNNLIFYCIF